MGPLETSDPALLRLWRTRTERCAKQAAATLGTGDPPLKTTSSMASGAAVQDADVPATCTCDNFECSVVLLLHPYCSDTCDATMEGAERKATIACALSQGLIPVTSVPTKKFPCFEITRDTTYFDTWDRDCKQTTL